jgi:hypothetical protein
VVKNFIVLLVIGAVAGALLWKKIAPNDEALIRARLFELADAASTDHRLAPLELVSRAKAAVSCVSQDVRIDYVLADGARRHLEGAQAVRETIVGAASRLAPFELSFLDVKVELAPSKKQAVVFATVRARNSAEKWEEVLELKFQFEKIQSQWLITQGEPTESLRK